MGVANVDGLMVKKWMLRMMLKLIHLRVPVVVVVLAVEGVMGGGNHHQKDWCCEVATALWTLPSSLSTVVQGEVACWDHHCGRRT
jgi:hypothetical protein